MRFNVCTCIHNVSKTKSVIKGWTMWEGSCCEKLSRLRMQLNSKRFFQVHTMPLEINISHWYLTSLQKWQQEITRAINNYPSAIGVPLNNTSIDFLYGWIIRNISYTLYINYISTFANIALFHCHGKGVRLRQIWSNLFQDFLAD